MLIVNVLFYVFMFAATVKNVYINYVVKSYQKVYDGQVVQVRLFDVCDTSYNKKSVRILYKLTILQNIYHICAWIWSRIRRSPWRPPCTFIKDRNLFIPTTTDHFYYEFTFWNGTKKLVRAQGSFVPNAVADAHAHANAHANASNAANDDMPSIRDKKILYVSMCGYDVTDFVNQYVSSLTKENNITACDLFAIAVLCSQVPSWARHYDANEDSANAVNANAFNATKTIETDKSIHDAFETEFIMCDEEIVKSRFKGTDVVYFHG